VSVFALQFAGTLGAQIISTTSTAEKAERLIALGASKVVNYTEIPDWGVKARELTDVAPAPPRPSSLSKATEGT
jgi:NADPH:quinone reductase-like Zn-dependent oxidoreductase